MSNDRLIRRGRTIDTISERRKEKLESIIRKRQPNLSIVLENIWDPHNVSAILRTADSVGIKEAHLLYYIEPAPDFKRIGKQSSSSANKWLDLSYHKSVEDCYKCLRQKGFLILASHLTKEAQPLYSIDATKNIAFVFGNEHRGVSDEACALADGLFYIPMMGIVQSLNASVAAAVTLYEACRQRLAAGMYEEAQMPESEILETLRHWSQR